MVWEEKIFKGFLLWLPWQQEFFMEQNYLKDLERGPPKKYSCEKTQSVVSEKKFFKEKVYGCTH